MTIDATASQRTQSKHSSAVQPHRRGAGSIAAGLWAALVAMLALGAFIGHDIWVASLLGAHAVLISPPLARIYRGPPWLRMTMAWSIFAAGLTVIGYANGATPVSTSDQPDNIAEAKVAPTQAYRIRNDETEFVDLQIQAKSELSAILKDPDSARYQNVAAVAPPAARGRVSFCGEVNAKNSYGGYTGYTRFFIAPGVGAWLRNSRGIKFNEVWRTLCRDEYIVREASGFN